MWPMDLLLLQMCVNDIDDVIVLSSEKDYQLNEKL